MFSFKKFILPLTLRTLKIDILSLFLSLTIVAFSCVILYSYYRSYQSILTYSKGTMERNSNAIIERIGTLGAELEVTLSDASSLFLNVEKLNVDNPELIKFMLDIVNFNDRLSSFFIGLPTGNLIEVGSVPLTGQTHFISEPYKLLPQNASFVVKQIDMANSNSPQSYIYKDNHYDTLGEERLKKINLNILIRPWYAGAIKARDLYWTDIYNFVDTQQPGISVAKPIYKNNVPVGVIGADLSFTAFSKFLLKQKIGKSGRAFILDDHGNVLIPEKSKIDQSSIPEKIVTSAFSEYQKNLNENFILEVENSKYLAYIDTIPKTFGKNWFVVILVPFADFFGELVQTQFQIAFITLIILLISILIIIYFSKRISQPIVILSKETDKITNLDLDSEKRIDSHIIEIKTMDNSIATLRNTLRSFAKYIPKEVVKQLLHLGKEIDLHVEKKQLTIFFSDIKDFTTLVELYSLDKLMPQLSEYFDGLSKIILANQGTIDKYIGDSVMAFWGAPLEIEDHAYYACITALRCLAFVNQFNKKCKEAKKPEFYTRFGVNTGNVVVGNIGTAARMNYTVLGDAVNIAARLQITDKVYHTNIIISEAVHQMINDRFLLRPLDTVEVKGKKQKIKIYELVAILKTDEEIGETAGQTELCKAFTDAYEAYTSGDLPQALTIFTEIHKKFPDDYPTQMYLERLKQTS